MKQILMLLVLMLAGCGALRPEIVQVQVTVHTEEPEQDLLVILSDSWRGTDNIFGGSNKNIEEYRLLTSNTPLLFPMYRSLLDNNVLWVTFYHPSYVGISRRISFDREEGEVKITFSELGTARGNIDNTCHNDKSSGLAIQCIKIAPESGSVRSGSVLNVHIYPVRQEEYIKKQIAKLSEEKIKEEYKRRYREEIDDVKGLTQNELSCLFWNGRGPATDWYYQFAFKHTKLDVEKHIERYAAYFSSLTQAYGNCQDGASFNIYSEEMMAKKIRDWQEKYQ
ncbi:hypothetical protein [Permianibacter aggregans]|uniref:Lipoprotein n=1 Tax=Permianibacter aggregans TaxID=1510150 RepID=A0A4R6U5C9_9GAMM|nr:hypothetical protein [Permianibacter aggregans]QGX39803.1 hypothetical protein E2H98_09095 [Permianibacter aggregans]TDQ41421.1 hypothetical protein EV696_1403 [Permianibacter aggregans]